MATQSSTTIGSRLLPLGLVLAGILAAAASLAERPVAVSCLLGFAWFVAAAAVLRALPGAPAMRLLSLALVAGGIASLIPDVALPAGWLALASLLAAFALREAVEAGSVAAWQVVVDAVTLGTSLAAILQGLDGASRDAGNLPWFAAAVTAVAAPWVGGCSRGAGATRSTLMAFSSVAALVAAITWSAAAAGALLAGFGLALMASMAAQGSLRSPLLMGSPAQQRRCRLARMGATLILPLAAFGFAAVEALQREVIPSVRVVTLVLLGCAVLVRGRIASGSSSSSSCESPGFESVERLGALGEYSRIVAHEVRNSLSVLFSTTDLLRRDRDAAQREELLDVLAEEGDRVRDVIDQLTAFADGEGDSQRSPLRLREIARSAAQRALSRSAWPEGLTIELDLGRGDDVVVADAKRLEVAVSHVLIAAARGGASRVRVESRREGRKRCLVVDGDGRASEALTTSLPSRLLSAASSEDGALGLAVAERTLTEHGGELLMSTPASGGLHAVITLPAEDLS